MKNDQSVRKEQPFRNGLTLKEAQEQGYGSVTAIKAQINRGVVWARKVGRTWFIPRKELDQMIVRRKAWLAKRNKTQ